MLIGYWLFYYKFFVRLYNFFSNEKIFHGEKKREIFLLCG